MTLAPYLSFSEFLSRPDLAGPEWQQPSRQAWLIVAKVIDGAPLSRSELRLFRAATGLKRIPRQPVRMVQLICGRRAGKTSFLASLAVWISLFAADWRRLLHPGEKGVVLLLGADRAQARVLANYAAAICTRPAIAADVTRRTADEIEFSNGAALQIGTSDARTVRSRTCLAVVGDEACFWGSTDDPEAPSSAEEVIAAAEPSMATIPEGGGWLLLSSSPWRPRGLMYKLWQDLHGQQRAADRAGAVCWVASSRTMNPNLAAKYAERKVQEDPVRARCEYVVDPSSPWRSTDADFIPTDAIEACTDWSVRERAVEASRTYWAFLDAAGGSGQDSACLAVASADPDGTVRLDCVRERRPRFIPAQVLAEFSATLAMFGLRQVEADAWAGSFVRDELAKHNIALVPAKLTKSEIYISALPLLLNGRARLLDDRRLRLQLASLQRVTRAGGREFVDGEKGKPEDLANAACGALVLASRPPQPMPTAAYGVYSYGFSDPRPDSEDLPPPRWMLEPGKEEALHRYRTRHRS